MVDVNIRIGATLNQLAKVVNQAKDRLTNLKIDSVKGLNVSAPAPAAWRCWPRSGALYGTQSATLLIDCRRLRWIAAAKRRDVCLET